MSVIVEDTDQVTEIRTKKIETRKLDVNNNVPLSKGVDSNSGTVEDTKQVEEITTKKTALNRTAAVQRSQTRKTSYVCQEKIYQM